MARQRRTGRIFFILHICDSIIASFHPLVQDEVVNWFLEMDLSGSRVSFFVGAGCDTLTFCKVKAQVKAEKKESALRSTLTLTSA
jgi:hypothetical protein